MCDSFFVGGRYHTVGTLIITVYPMQTPDPEGDLLCTGVRSTRYGDVTRELRTPYCSILLYPFDV